MVSDISMGGMSGMELLRRVREGWPELRVILVTGYGSIELAVEAMKRGAVHFITKPFDNQDILMEVERHGREALLVERCRSMKPRDSAGGVLLSGEDPGMAAVMELVDQVAPTNMPVLIHGESGTGKELVARAIHERSRDPALPFVPVNSAGLPDSLLESELFGHEKGAFTGADSRREGIFAKARGGTVFLDEIALMSLAFQGKLLRVLQQRTVTPLGSADPVEVDFRLVAATNRSLRQRIDDGEFREDLYYRIRVVTIEIPPLRDRSGDIVLLARHFLALYSSEVGRPADRLPQFSAAALNALQAHRWPGNVRELENCIRRALILCRGDSIGVEHLSLSEDGDPAGSEGLSYEEEKQKTLEAFRRRVVERALRSTGGNVTQAAEACGLTRAAFQRIMRSLDLDRADFAD